MKVLDFSTAHAEFTDEIINVANSNAQSLIHSLFYNKTGKLVEVWTGAGKTGTQLTITTDFTVGDVYPDASLPTSISPDVAYRSISIVNATYHNTDLYVSYYPITDLATAEKWNNDIPYYHLTGTAADFTFRKERQYRYNKIILTFTRDASARTITLPDATDDFWKGVEFTIKVVGSGSGDVTLDEVNSVNINLTDASTQISLVFNGEGMIKLVSNGTDYDVVSTGVWDRGTVADSGSNIDRSYKKTTDGDLFNSGAYDFGGVSGSIVNANTGTYGWSFYSYSGAVVFGIPYISVSDDGITTGANTNFTGSPAVSALTSSGMNLNPLATASPVGGTAKSWYKAIGRF